MMKTEVDNIKETRNGGFQKQQGKCIYKLTMIVQEHIRPVQVLTRQNPSIDGQGEPELLSQAGELLAFYSCWKRGNLVYLVM